MDGKSRGRARRDGGHAAGRPAGAKVKRTISLDAARSRRLDVHAACTGRDLSDLVAEWIDLHCRRFVVHDRGAAAGAGGGEAPMPEAEGEGRGG